MASSIWSPRYPTHKTTSAAPYLERRSSWCKRNGRPATSTIGFGRPPARSPRRLPTPPASMQIGGKAISSLWFSIIDPIHLQRGRIGRRFDEAWRDRLAHEDASESQVHAKDPSERLSVCLRCRPPRPRGGTPRGRRRAPVGLPHRPPRLHGFARSTRDQLRPPRPRVSPGASQLQRNPERHSLP